MIELKEFFLKLISSLISNWMIILWSQYLYYQTVFFNPNVLYNQDNYNTN